MSLIQFVNHMGESLERGDVVVIGSVTASQTPSADSGTAIIEADVTDAAYDTRVCGIVCELHTEMKSEGDPEAASGAKTRKTKGARKGGATAPNIPQAFTLADLENLDRTKIQDGQLGYLITQGPYTHCKVDADIAAIKAGDLLTTSPTRGHAQKVLDPGKATGSIIGKALGSLKKGKGEIPVLVTLQ